MSRTLTPADLSRRLGQRRREARASNPQYSEDTGHKMFGSSKYVRLLPLLFPTLHHLTHIVHQSVGRHC
jgi:hypothetical protein